MRDNLLKSLFILLIFFPAYGKLYAQEVLSVGHIFKKKNRIEQITASIYSHNADTVNFKLYCKPDNGHIEYHKIPVRNKKASTTSGIYCPQKVVIEARTLYSTQYDTLNVALIRKINQCRNKGCKKGLQVVVKLVAPLN